MSHDEDYGASPPDFGADDDNTNDNSMFVSAISPATVDISLSGAEEDDDDENPFGIQSPPPPRQKTPTNTTNTVESSVDNEKNLFQQDNSKVRVDDDDDDLFGGENTNNNPPSPSAPPQPFTTVPKPQTPTPVKSASPLYPTDLNTSSPQSTQSTTPFKSQVSSSTPVSNSGSSETTTTSKPVQKRSGENNIEVTVSDPTKVGDGMSSYMTYRITTKTTLSTFKKSDFSVNRRFSDFLGLHTKIVLKYLHLGIIIPSPPEKDSMSMAKVKIAKDEAIPTDFIDRRRALLERYLNRLVHHEKLIEDSDLREFLEMPNDLPKSKDTQALSGAGVLRALSNISSSVTKLTTKKTEQDQWFEEKHLILVDLQTHLKHVHNQLNVLFSQRKEAGQALKQFSISLNHLATNEEQPSLSSALTELANIQEKLDQINVEHTFKEYSILTELIKEYIFLLDMVHLAFNERIKLHQQWLNSEETLKKKRETKTKLEQTPKGADKLPQAEMEIKDWEGRVEQSKEEFERISKTIKEEMDVFEQIRIDDFKKSIEDYLKNLLEQQEKILQIWEGYLPEANKINL